MEGMKRAIARINGNESATAFLISEQYMLTVKHIFKENNNLEDYTITFLGDTKKYSINDIHIEKESSISDIKSDIAIIKLNECVNHVQPLELDFSQVNRDEEWQAYGFPGSKYPEIERFVGTIHDLLEDGVRKFDMNLHCTIPQIIDANYGLAGASGSPILRNNKVIGIMSNESGGAILGGVSVKCSKQFLHHHLPNLKVSIVKSEVQIALEEAILSTERFIEGFPDELEEFMKNKLKELEIEIMDNPDKFLDSLTHYKYPSAKDSTKLIGLETILEFILMIKCISGNIEMLVTDDFANLRIKGIKNKNLNMNFIYAHPKNQFMPEILLQKHKQMMNTSAAQLFIDNGTPVPPYPMVFDNCSNSIKHNLCKSCGKAFKFEEILHKYIATEDDGLIKGIEENNFSSLNKVIILCADCIKKVRDEIEFEKDFAKKVVEKIYD